MNPLILPAMGEIASLLFFWNNNFGIQQPMKVDMPLNKETNNVVNEFKLQSNDYVHFQT